MSALHIRPGLWAGITFAGFATIAGLRLSDAISATTGFILLACCFLPALMFVRAMRPSRGNAHCASNAVYRYNRVMMLSGLGYALGLGLGLTLYDRMDPGPLASFALALLPIVPIFAMIWGMARYLVEESDEYLRHRATMASLFGLGVLLAVASFWGFLETFGIAPHVEGWMAFPVWALGMGAAQGWMVWHGRAGAEA